MNLLTMPAQAIDTPSRNINPFHAIIEHKRAIKCKVRLNLWDVEKKEVQPPIRLFAVKGAPIVEHKKNRKQQPSAGMQKKSKRGRTGRGSSKP